MWEWREWTPNPPLFEASGWREELHNLQMSVTASPACSCAWGNVCSLLPRAVEWFTFWHFQQKKCRRLTLLFVRKYLQYNPASAWASISAFIILISVSLAGNFYGTPKPPAEPSPFQPDPVDQVLFDNDFDTESQRKRTTSVSKMQRMDSSLPEDEEEEEKEAVNGSGGIGWLQGEKFPEVFYEWIRSIQIVFMLAWTASLVLVKFESSFLFRRVFLLSFEITF